MTIGIYDDDFLTRKYGYFNLDLMKISSYYKKRNQIVSLITVPLPKAIDKYNKIIYYKNYDTKGYMPPVFKADNISYGGLYFSNFKYLPLPEKIQKESPDKTLYNKGVNTFTCDYASKNFYKKQQNGEHAYFEYKDKVQDLSKYYASRKTTRVFFLHDYDIKHREELIKFNKEISKYNCTIGNQFPLIVYDEQELIHLLDNNMLAANFFIEFRGMLSDAAYVEVVEKLPRKINYTFFYNFTYFIEKEEQVYNGFFARIIYQIMYLKKFRKNFTLTYTVDFIENYELLSFLELLATYTSTIVTLRSKNIEAALKYDTIYSLCSRLKHNKYKRWLNVEETRQAFRLLGLKDYEVFKMLYECREVEFIGGELVDVSKKYNFNF